jgi:hypothetical protein
MSKKKITVLVVDLRKPFKSSVIFVTAICVILIGFATSWFLRNYEVNINKIESQQQENLYEPPY